MLDPPHCLHASSAVVLADSRPAALLAPASYAVVLADARPARIGLSTLFWAYEMTNLG
jgi:hypothetical protein